MILVSHAVRFGCHHCGAPDLAAVGVPLDGNNVSLSQQLPWYLGTPEFEMADFRQVNSLSLNIHHRQVAIPVFSGFSVWIQCHIGFNVRDAAQGDDIPFLRNLADPRLFEFGVPPRNSE